MKNGMNNLEKIDFLKKEKNYSKKRKEHVERSFADSKQNHGYRYAMYKGIKKNQHYTWLICAAQNMKNIAIKKDKIKRNALIYVAFFKEITNTLQKLQEVYQNFKILKTLRKKSGGLSTL